MVNTDKDNIMKALLKNNPSEASLGLAFYLCLEINLV